MSTSPLQLLWGCGGQTRAVQSSVLCTALSVARYNYNGFFYMNQAENWTIVEHMIIQANLIKGSIQLVNFGIFFCIVHCTVHWTIISYFRIYSTIILYCTIYDHIKLCYICTVQSQYIVQYNIIIHCTIQYCIILLYCRIQYM